MKHEINNTTKLTFLENINHAELTARTPLTLLTKPYASNADIPNLLNDSRLNLFVLLVFVKNPLTVDRKLLVDFSLLRLCICDAVSESVTTSACLLVSSSWPSLLSMSLAWLSTSSPSFSGVENKPTVGFMGDVLAIG